MDGHNLRPRLRAELHDDESDRLSSLEPRPSIPRYHGEEHEPLAHLAYHDRKVELHIAFTLQPFSNMAITALRSTSSRFSF